MAVNPDGEIVATVGIRHDGSTLNGTVKLWDARTGDLRRALNEEKDCNPAIAFSRDLLAISLHKTREVRLLDAKTLELKHTIDESHVPDLFGSLPSLGFSSTTTLLAFSPDGKRLALAGSTLCDGFEPFLKLWDVEKHKLIEGNAGVGLVSHELVCAACLGFSPDGNTLAVVWNDAKIRLFDGHTGEFRTLLETNLEVGTWFPREIAFSPDSKSLVGVGDDYKTLIVWDLGKGEPRRRLKGHTGPIHRRRLLG